jgi:exo-1,4-beta-D-glucosaminidase
MLRDGWQVQTSSGQPEGAAISKAGFATSGWYPTAVPATVSGVLAQAGVYPDPFFGTNLRAWPGMGGRGGRGNGRSGMPRSNPFSVAWWFRTEFDLPAEMAGRAITLHFEGINYRAEVWLNGERIADTNEVAGAMRRFAFDAPRPRGRAKETRSRC